ncbi:hypothetical protein C8R47DRAFT_1244009 [Mycena vitilis]|nr:hypothetical protein C8R47DRAFT_1244009 [Mycena vitilis]
MRVQQVDYRQRAEPPPRAFVRAEKHIYGARARSAFERDTDMDEIAPAFCCAAQHREMFRDGLVEHATQAQSRGACEAVKRVERVTSGCEARAGVVGVLQDKGELEDGDVLGRPRSNLDEKRDRRVGECTRSDPGGEFSQGPMAPLLNLFRLLGDAVRTSDFGDRDLEEWVFISMYWVPCWENAKMNSKKERVRESSRELRKSSERLAICTDWVPKDVIKLILLHKRL